MGNLAEMSKIRQKLQDRYNLPGTMGELILPLDPKTNVVALLIEDGETFYARLAGKNLVWITQGWGPGQLAANVEDSDGNYVDTLEGDNVEEIIRLAREM